jgi:hypothetical protein
MLKRIKFICTYKKKENIQFTLTFNLFSFLCFNFHYYYKEEEIFKPFLKQTYMKEIHEKITGRIELQLSI